jgi:hypothetical protein
MWRGISRNADVVVLAAACCFGTGLFLAWTANGFTWSSREQPTAAPTNTVPSTNVARPPARPQPRPRSAPRPAHGSSAMLTLVAARGSAWVSLRAGSPSGKTLYEGLLALRRKITIREPRVVARFQAGSNLVAVVGGRRADLARYELRDVIITRVGIRLLAVARRTGAPAVIAS